MWRKVGELCGNAGFVKDFPENHQLLWGFTSIAFLPERMHGMNPSFVFMLLFFDLTILFHHLPSSSKYLQQINKYSREKSDPFSWYGKVLGFHSCFMFPQILEPLFRFQQGTWWPLSPQCVGPGKKKGQGFVEFVGRSSFIDRGNTHHNLGCSRELRKTVPHLLVKYTWYKIERNSIFAGKYTWYKID